MKLKKNLLFVCTVAILSGVAISGCVGNEKKEEISIYYTTDLHSHFTKNLDNYLKKIDRTNSILIDTGDIMDGQTDDDDTWLMNAKELGSIEVSDKPDGEPKFFGNVMEKFDRSKDPVPPIIKKLFEHNYDVEVVGNHELTYGIESFGMYVDSFKGKNTAILSNNIFYEDGYNGHKKGDRVVDPYMIKSFDTKEGKIKVAIVGATTNFINEEKSDAKSDREDTKNLLQNNPGYKGKMYMTDLVDETEKVVKEVREKEKPDVVILAVHSGLKPKKPKHFGNRVQELAKTIEGVDMIIGGHNHSIEDHVILPGVGGKDVVYTEAGAHSNGIGNAKITLVKDGDKWKVKSIDSKIDRFKKDKSDPEEDVELSSIEEYRKVNGYKLFDKESYNELKKNNPDVYISFVITPKDGEKFDGRPGVKVYNNLEYDGSNLYYLETRDFDTFVDLSKKYQFQY